MSSMRSSVLAVALLVAAAGCAPATSTDQRDAGGGGVHGSMAPWSEAIAQKVPLHVEGKVLSRFTVQPKDDPYWPKDTDDPEVRWTLEDPDRWHAVWEVEVLEWLKGTSAPTLRVVRAAHGSEDYGSYDFIEPGGTYIFYLDIASVEEGLTAEETEEIERNLAAHPPLRHWILGRAEPVDEPTFPGAGAIDE